MYGTKFLLMDPIVCLVQHISYWILKGNQTDLKSKIQRVPVQKVQVLQGLNLKWIYLWYVFVLYFLPKNESIEMILYEISFWSIVETRRHWTHKHNSFSLYTLRTKGAKRVLSLSCMRTQELQMNVFLLISSNNNTNLT